MSTKVFYRYHNRLVDKKLYRSDAEDSVVVPPPPANFLALENGSLLLQEDGSRIIIT